MLLFILQCARIQTSLAAGFMAKLLQLDQKLYGKQTVKVALSASCSHSSRRRWRLDVGLAVQVKKIKPEPRICPVCEEKVGISGKSLALHVKKAHPERYAELRNALD